MSLRASYNWFPKRDGVVLWQLNLSPHMAGLASALARSGEAVTVIAAESVPRRRRELGWDLPEMPGVSVRMVSPPEALDLADASARTSIHICQGLRRNGYVSAVMARLSGAHARWGSTFETIDDRGVAGLLRRLDYQTALRRRSSRPDFVLAIGARTSGWLGDRGYRSDSTFPFAYFLDRAENVPEPSPSVGPFRFGFVGSLITLKRVDLLIRALKRVEADVELLVVGTGPEEVRLRRIAEASLTRTKVLWLGRLSMRLARQRIAELDCLVLPSAHDGWGAVVSEALIAGVPAICSDACGSSAVVRASGAGAVFKANDVVDLADAMRDVIAKRLDARARLRLRDWANATLTADAGADYLRAIIRAVYGDGGRPEPPWATLLPPV